MPAWQHTPVVSAPWETEEGGSIEYMSLRPVCATQQDPTQTSKQNYTSNEKYIRKITQNGSYADILKV